MKMKVIFNYVGKGLEGTTFESDWVLRHNVQPLISDLEKSGKSKNIMIVDELGAEWSKKEYMKLNQQLETEPENVILYFDGGFHKETNVAGIGVVVYYDKNGESYRYRRNNRLESIQHNNEAEYAALFEALMSLEDIGVQHTVCEIKGDAQGLIKQLQGEWPCYEATLNRWLDRIEEKINNLPVRASYSVIKRNQNKEAHQLASQALEGKEIHSHKKQL
ncbi:reverse transcriptase-like protein [Bacillus sp. 2205SS5-2]|uniref:reverse transcriptase-like protein n=1 Tax=Bacillus sp. 2205SS5-2 TaxID=3109031 RepID=UPI00300488A4